MYQKCPKCGYERQPTDTACAESCPACGLVFAKWLKQRFSADDRESGSSAASVASATRAVRDSLIQQLTYVQTPADSLSVYGRMLVYGVFLVWGWHFILSGMDSAVLMSSFMHNVNLVFHEAGHFVFRPFGRFMTILGGSLGQLLIPVIVVLAFVLNKRDNFGAAGGLWWFGQSCMDLAPYINDARALKLVLLGGGTGADRPGMHDWRNILGELGLLNYDGAIAAATFLVGAIAILLSFLWGGYVLYRQYGMLRNATWS
jgi:hypothetical protein